jgi:hypothetical protein
MSHVRRAVACAGALAVSLFSFAVSASTTANAVDPASKATADAAVTWLKSQQLPDGGFELAAFPGFETRDAALAIAEDAQTGTTWSTGEALAAVGAVKYQGSGATPLDALDDYAATITTAGAAGKTIVLSAAPLGLDPAAFDPAGDGTPIDLVALMGCGTTNEAAFNNLLYVALGQDLACAGGTQPAIVDAVRAAQQADGGWNFIGDPTGADIDLDTTALAVEVLVAAGADVTDPVLAHALQFFADNQQPNGSWQSFGTDDPNSTALAIFGITALGFDVESRCWKDTARPSAVGTAYASPTVWLRSQQLTSPPADAGRIASPNDSFGVNTFATSQSVEGLLQSWLPVVRAAPQTCVAPVPPVDPVPPVNPVEPGQPGAPAVEAVAVTATPRFTG